MANAIEMAGLRSQRLCAGSHEHESRDARGTGPAGFVVVFRADETRLTDCEFSELRRWIRSRRRADRPLDLIMGCCADSGRQGRLLRLHDLRKQLAKCGVAEASIRCTDEWIAPPRQRGVPGLPSDVACLNTVDPFSAIGSVRSIRSLFAKGGEQQEVACTRES